MKQVQKLAEQLLQADEIAILTGAGISTASGIPDFRSTDGIYTKHANIEYLLSEEYYAKEPTAFWKSFKEIFFLNNIHQFQPNIGHLLLRQLEERGKKVTIITQNIDGLHRKANSSIILEVHGSIIEAHCPNCKQGYDLAYILREEIPRCERDQFILKSDVVLFGGTVKHLEAAYDAVSTCDLFMTLGSSLQVYPVKDLPNYAARKKHVKTAIINFEETPMDHLFDYVIHADIIQTFQQIERIWNT